MGIWTIPNFISVTRLIFLFPLIRSLQRERIIECFIWMALCAFTDMLDGYVARRWNMQSEWGRILDPVIDKTIVLTLMIYLAFSSIYNFPLWFMIFMGARELFILSGSYIVLRRHKLVLESKRSGKNSAFVTGLAVLLFIMKMQPVGWMVLYTAVVMNLYSTWIYSKRFYAYLTLKTSSDSTKEVRG